MCYFTRISPLNNFWILFDLLYFWRKAGSEFLRIQNNLLLCIPWYHLLISAYLDSINQNQFNFEKMNRISMPNFIPSIFVNHDSWKMFIFRPNEWKEHYIGIKEQINNTIISWQWIACLHLILNDEVMNLRYIFFH